MFENPAEQIRNQLIHMYTRSELRTFVTLILKDVCNLSLSDIVACKFNELSDKEKQKINCIVNRLKNNEPIQYILGKTEFYGLDFKINSSVLIPRPETEELVEWILSDIKNTNPHVLDVGTGSGCIAITIAKHLQYATVDAWDISEEALVIARENSRMNRVTVQFSKVDVLEEHYSKKKYDIVVSNPPYIKESEKEVMDENVLNFEPHEALFVSNEEALIFYDRIADIAKKQLKNGGLLYFEINQTKGEEIVQLLINKNFQDVELKKDISGNNRMVKAVK
ncbi:MAG: peptide chain release factor N(5)-glutamine methyltransferase [Dysgonamonadaceae bacterium]|jgi:release factor glutamine methyltransferase|nr:peptide chain release factor N(5)-glutamine methyltransferase [Dysgonamonadaceae bacterium]